MLKVLTKLSSNFGILLFRDYGGVIFIYSGGALVLVLVLLLDPKRITFYLHVWVCSVLF